LVTGIPLDVNASPSSSTIDAGTITLQVMGGGEAEGDTDSDGVTERVIEDEGEGYQMVPRKL